MNARRTTCQIALVSGLLAAVVACAGAPATTVVAAPTAPPAPPRPAAWVASTTPGDGRLRGLERAGGVVCARGFQAQSEGVLPDDEDDVRRESAAVGGHLEVRVGGGGLEVVARGPSSEVTGTCARVQE